MTDCSASTVRPIASTAASGVPSCAVVVMSSDKYRDLWQPFFTLFWKHWPDCPFPVFLGTTGASYNDARVISIPSGDFAWSKTFRLVLEQVDAEYVFLLLEDFFLESPIETDEIQRHILVLRELDGTMLRLFPAPGPDSELAGYEGIGRIHPHAPWRVSLQAGLWNRRRLLGLIRDEESIWDFERSGTARSRIDADGFYATYKPLARYRHVVERGEWFRTAARDYSTQQIGCDFVARPVMSRAVSLRKVLSRSRKNLFDCISSLLRKSSWPLR